MSNSIKFIRVAARAEMGGHPATFEAIWEAIPASVRAALTSAQLVELADAMYAQERLGRAHEQADVRELIGMNAWELPDSCRDGKHGRR